MKNNALSSILVLLFVLNSCVPNNVNTGDANPQLSESDQTSSGSNNGKGSEDKNDSNTQGHKGGNSGGQGGDGGGSTSTSTTPLHGNVPTQNGTQGMTTSLNDTDTQGKSAANRSQNANRPKNTNSPAVQALLDSISKLIKQDNIKVQITQINDALKAGTAGGASAESLSKTDGVPERIKIIDQNTTKDSAKSAAPAGSPTKKSSGPKFQSLEDLVNAPKISSQDVYIVLAQVENVLGAMKAFTAHESAPEDSQNQSQRDSSEPAEMGKGNQKSTQGPHQPNSTAENSRGRTRDSLDNLPPSRARASSKTKTTILQLQKQRDAVDQLKNQLKSLADEVIAKE